MSLPLVLVGYGDIARRVALRFPDAAVHALSRHGGTRPSGHGGDWVAHKIDLDHLASGTRLPAGAVWVYLAPPPSTGIADTRVAGFLRHADEERFLPRQVIYASTTGVYGDQSGEWVTEHTPPQPRNDRGRRRLDAEHRWVVWCRKKRIPLTILRIPGIYACDRLPLERVRAGTTVVCPEQAPWSNRIHAEDLADAIRLLIERGVRGDDVAGIFNIADGNPQPMSELYLRIAEYLGLPRPECQPLAEVLQHASPMVREFLSESKRVDAGAIRALLGWRPRYPDLPTALTDCRKQGEL